MVLCGTVLPCDAMRVAVECGGTLLAAPSSVPIYFFFSNFVFQIEGEEGGAEERGGGGKREREKEERARGETIVVEQSERANERETREIERSTRVFFPLSMRTGLVARGWRSLPACATIVGQF